MNKLFNKTAIASIVALSVLSMSGCDHAYKLDYPVETKDGASAAAVKVKFDNKSVFEEKAAYAIGASLGEYVAQMQKQQKQLIGELPESYIISGFNDGVKGKSALGREEVETILKDLDKQIQEKIEVETKKAAEDNKKNGEAFLKDNAKKEGVITTESGLQYRVIKKGDGVKPKAGDIISVTYKGKTIDGNVFDEQDKPVEFPLDNMIPGWVEGLPLMNVGSEFEFYIPAKLAYGENGAGQFIKPNSVLIFEVKLVDVKKPEEKKSEEKKGEEKVVADVKAEEKKVEAKQTEEKVVADVKAEEKKAEEHKADAPKADEKKTTDAKAE